MLLAALLPSASRNSNDRDRRGRTTTVASRTTTNPHRTPRASLGPDSRPAHRDSITVSVLAYEPLGFLEYGTSGTGQSMRKTPARSFPADEPVEIKLTGLTPDARYVYRFHARAKAADAFARSSDFSFRTARPSGRAVHVHDQSDSHLDANTTPELYARTLANALADAPDFHFELGDTFHDRQVPQPRGTRPGNIWRSGITSVCCVIGAALFALGNHDGERGRYLDGTANNKPSGRPRCARAICQSRARRVLFGQ